MTLCQAPFAFSLRPSKSSCSSCGKVPFRAYPSARARAEARVTGPAALGSTALCGTAEAVGAEPAAGRDLDSRSGRPLASTSRDSRGRSTAAGGPLSSSRTLPIRSARYVRPCSGVAPGQLQVSEWLPSALPLLPVSWRSRKPPPLSPPKYSTEYHLPTDILCASEGGLPALSRAALAAASESSRRDGVGVRCGRAEDSAAATAVAWPARAALAASASPAPLTTGSASSPAALSVPIPLP